MKQIFVVDSILKCWTDFLLWLEIYLFHQLVIISYSFMPVAQKILVLNA